MYYFQSKISHNFSSADDNSMILTEIKRYNIPMVPRKTDTVSLLLQSVRRLIV
jgi:hypothetical protein